MQAGLPARYIAQGDLKFVILLPPLLGQPVLVPPRFVKLYVCFSAAVLDKHDFIYLRQISMVALAGL